MGSSALVTLAASPASGAFNDITVAKSGPAAPGITYGLGWGDFDLDGDPDCMVSRHFERPIIFDNLGNGSLHYGFSPPLFQLPDDHHGPLLADFDEDGDLDIYLTAGADAGFGDSLKRMYRNDGAYTFVDVGPAWGVTDLLGRGRASSAMDVEGDGDVDIFVAKASRVAAPNSLFLNDGNQSYTDVAAAAGLADSFGSVGGIWGDYDRDGDPDLFIGGEEEVSFETRLYRNNGNLTFTNVTAQALPGIGQVAAAAWGDADNDGDLDLAVGLGDRALFDAVSWDADTLLYFFNTRYGDDGLDGVGFLQTGDSATYNVTLDGYQQASAVFVSEEGWNPFIVPFTVPFGGIHGAPTFTAGTTLATYIWTQQFFGVWEMRCNAPPQAGHSFAGIITTNGDFTDVGLVAPETYTHGPRGTRLWRNDGGTFTNVSAAFGLVDTVNVHFLQFVDVDQDGFLDLYVENAGDTQTLNGPNVFYRNMGGTSFQDETAAQQLSGPARGLGDAFAFEDYDSDGDLDVAITGGTGPRFLALLERVRFYRNNGPVGNRLRVKLEGLYSTRDGYGAWVTCISATAGRQVRYVTGNTWRGGQTMLDPYFGLGPDTVVDTLRVEWPSGSVNELVAVPAGIVTIEEFDHLTAVPAAAPGAPALRLVAGPNPSTGAIVLTAEGRRDGMAARLMIWDAAGRRLVNRNLAPGEARVTWDARDAEGAPVAAGVYFARLVEGTRVADVKVVQIGR